jgi:hypothetical protein
MMGKKKVTSLFEILARDGGKRETIGIVHVVDQPVPAQASVPGLAGRTAVVDELHGRNQQ